MRYWAAEALRSLGALAVPTLRAALASDAPESRRLAARALTLIPDDGPRALAEDSEHLEPAVRRAVAWALGACAYDEGFPVPILQRFLQDADAEVRWTAVWGLAQSLDPGAVEAGSFQAAVRAAVPDCLAVAASGRPDARIRAVRVLALPYAATVDPANVAVALANALRDDESAGEAANADWPRLGAHGARALVGLLDEPENVDAAVHALRRIGWPALGTLRALARDEQVSMSIRDLCVQIMEDIEDNDEPPPGWQPPKPADPTSPPSRSRPR